MSAKRKEDHCQFLISKRDDDDDDDDDEKNAPRVVESSVQKRGTPRRHDVWT